MNRHHFASDPQVKAFVSWLAPRLNTLTITLNIPHHQRFVPGGVIGVFTGVEAVTRAYLWKSTGMSKGDWSETRRHTAHLSNSLRRAVATKNNAATLTAAWDVIQWGGGNQARGAYPFLVRQAPNLPQYLRKTRWDFYLRRANDTAVPHVQVMNSMLTKVHAFLATDGLPIYDSRVAVAIATLVEAWRQANMLTAASIPRALNFPSVPWRVAKTTPLRTVHQKYPHAILPPHLNNYSATSCAAWSSAKIRLGWLLQELLSNTYFFNTEEFSRANSLADRTRAFEAALFMIGYDVSCLP